MLDGREKDGDVRPRSILSSSGAFCPLPRDCQAPSFFESERATVVWHACIVACSPEPAGAEEWTWRPVGKLTEKSRPRGGAAAEEIHSDGRQTWTG